MTQEEKKMSTYLPDTIQEEQKHWSLIPAFANGKGRLGAAVREGMTRLQPLPLH